MGKWFRKHIGLIGTVLTLLIGIFPQVFSKIGIAIKFVAVNYWLPVSIVMIIILLVFISLLLLKQQKSDPSK